MDAHGAHGIFQRLLVAEGGKSESEVGQKNGGETSFWKDHYNHYL